MTQKVDLQELRQIVDAIIRRALAKRDSSEVALEQNLYWHVPSPGVYKVTKDAPNPDIGSLHDDWESLKDIATGEQEPLVNNFVGLSQLLRYIGELLGDELAKDGG